MYLYLVVFYFYIVFIRTENIYDRQDCKVTPTPNSERVSSGPSRLARILGGEKAKIKDVPYMAAVLMDGSLICGASILSTWWVVTAAWCVEQIQGKENVKIRVKSAKYKKDGQEVNVKYVFKHPDYNKTTRIFDVGLVKVEEHFISQPDRYRELFLSSSSPEAGQKLTISGWGEKKEGKGPTKRLKWANVTVQNREACPLLFRLRKQPFPSTDFCAGDYTNKKDACKGDTGGPAVKDGTILVGIISIPGCGKDGVMLSAYTDVFQVAVWINETIKKNTPIASAFVVTAA